MKKGLKLTVHDSFLSGLQGPSHTRLKYVADQLGPSKPQTSLLTKKVHRSKPDGNKWPILETALKRAQQSQICHKIVKNCRMRAPLANGHIILWRVSQLTIQAHNGSNPLKLSPKRIILFVEGTHAPRGLSLSQSECACLVLFSFSSSPSPIWVVNHEN